MGRRYDYSGDTETVGLDVDAVEAETDKALLLSFPDIGESIWTPKSQIHNLEELEDGLARGETSEVEVSQWWAQKNDLI